MLYGIQSRVRLNRPLKIFWLSGDLSKLVENLIVLQELLQLTNLMSRSRFLKNNSKVHQQIKEEYSRLLISNGIKSDLITATRIYTNTDKLEEY